MNDASFSTEKLERWWKAIAWVIIPALLIAGPLYWFYSYGMVPGPGPEEGDEVLVTIPQGHGFRGVYEALLESDVIHDDVRFSLLASWRGISKHLQAGEYIFPRPITPDEVLNLLVKGATRQHPVTFPEGLTIYEVAALLDENGWAEQNTVVGLCHDQDFIHSLGLEVESLEGYLFPDTYHLSRDQSGKRIIRMMVERFFQVEDELRLREGGHLGPESLVIKKSMPKLSLHEKVTLASIVEKETGLDSERPLVARVFLNRLSKNMRLQADPTVIYGLGKRFDGNLTREDLRTPSPYNTYIIKGLPKGPIANPGRAALEAVLHPAQGDWLYFVAKGDGSHHFSTTLAEHNRAVRQYQRRKQ